MKTINGKPLIDGVNDLETLALDRMAQAHELASKYDLPDIKLDQIARVIQVLRIEDRMRVRAALLNAADLIDDDHDAIDAMAGLFVNKSKGAAE